MIQSEKVRFLSNKNNQTKKDYRKISQAKRKMRKNQQRLYPNNKFNKKKRMDSMGS